MDARIFAYGLVILSASLFYTWHEIESVKDPKEVSTHGYATGAYAGQRKSTTQAGVKNASNGANSLRLEPDVSGPNNDRSEVITPAQREVLKDTIQVGQAPLSRFDVLISAEVGDYSNRGSVLYRGEIGAPMDVEDYTNRGSVLSRGEIGAPMDVENY